MAPIPRHQQDHLLPLSAASTQPANVRVGEKTIIEPAGYERHLVSPPLSKPSRMPTARALLVALLVGCLVVVGFAHSDSSAPDDACSSGQEHACIEVDVAHDKSALARLIDSASPEALHKFLHTVTGFQHGVFDSDHAAVEAVLEIDPALSSTVAQLQRRQNGTTTDDPGNTQSSSSANEPPTTTTSTPDQSTPPVESSTPTVSEPSTSLPSTTDSVVVPPTTTSGPTPTTPTGSSSSSPSNTEQTTTTGPATTSTTDRGPTTSPPRPSTCPKTNVQTTTLPGGAVLTLTSVTFVTPGVPETPTTSKTVDASLQSGAAVPVGSSQRLPLLELLVGGIAAMAILA
ncbi:uncharacterized protein B0I36DRAFT_320035 [Microdochium trichocladiopsis]|uniref:Uncharacterized protein n=1 Tax=Microdochium trichocladiopsis TaxID=1682393 RepID=A0A9P9BRG5_9PEZI|nr:uncharacterized protein B0I36DRAFT_320035 [Microdochium trichocladiopsis]KAH7032785.1 hypothetical protein B0I36DRAFT_320035 [Microdochium trichocladiopsis]